MKHGFGFFETTLLETNGAQKIERPTHFRIASEHLPELLLRFLEAFLFNQLGNMRSSRLLREEALAKTCVEEQKKDTETARS